VPALGEKYVGGLDVPMNDSLVVGRTKCVRNLNPQFKYFPERKWLAGNAVLQRLPAEKLHRNEGLAVVFDDFIDGANIWMVQGGSSLCLTIETAQSLRIWREPVRKELQGNEAMELGILGLKNDAHTAATEFLDDSVVGDGLAD